MLLEQISYKGTKNKQNLDTDIRKRVSRDNP